MGAVLSGEAQSEPGRRISMHGRGPRARSMLRSLGWRDARWLLLWFASLSLLSACALPSALRLPSTRRLESQVGHLQAELQRREQELSDAEANLRGHPSRAAAVSAVAEARIQVQRAARRAPGNSAKIVEADRKLADAEGQMRSGHFGAAIFFADRARRLAESLRPAASHVNTSSRNSTRSR